MCSARLDRCRAWWIWAQKTTWLILQFSKKNQMPRLKPFNNEEFGRLMVLSTFGYNLQLPAFCLNSGPTSVSWWYLWFQALALQVVLMPCIRIQGVSWPTGDVLCSLTSSLERWKHLQDPGHQVESRKLFSKVSKIYWLDTHGSETWKLWLSRSAQSPAVHLVGPLSNGSASHTHSADLKCWKRCCEKCVSGNDPNLQKFRVGI